MKNILETIGTIFITILLARGLLFAETLNEFLFIGILVAITGMISLYRVIEKHMFPDYFKRKLQKSGNGIIAQYIVLLFGFLLSEILLILLPFKNFNSILKGVYYFGILFFLLGIILFLILIYIEKKR